MKKTKFTEEQIGKGVHVQSELVFTMNQYPHLNRHSHFNLHCYI